MTLTREHLSPADGFDNRIDWQTLLDRWNRRALRWVLGPGLLSLHLAAFGLSLLAPMTWNLIADPTDLRMVEPFRYWGVIVSCPHRPGGRWPGRLEAHPPWATPDSRRRQSPPSVAAGRGQQRLARRLANCLERSTVAVARVNSSARRWLPMRRPRNLLNTGARPRR